MNRTRMVAGAGAAAVLALCVGTALALGGGLDRGSASGDVLPVLLDSSSSSSDTSTTDSTSPAFPSTSGSTTSDTATPVPTAPTAPGGIGAGVGADEAGRIALARVGGGHITGVEQEVEHGRLEWKIRISHAGQGWDIRVDAGNGTITRVRSDGDSGGGDRDGDDNSGRGGGDDHGGDDNSGRGGGDDHGDDNSGSGSGGDDHGGRG